MLRGAETLPARAIADEVVEGLRTHDRLVVTAPPGAGKSTLLPLRMLEALEGTALMLEPRRLAARQVAERMAWMLDEAPGRTVGWRMRFDSRTSADTRLEVVTEGILTRRLIDDPTLEGVSAVIFDEFHERSLTADVALTLTRQVQQLLRPELKIIIMSATIDADAISAALEAPVVSCEGRLFPVEVHMAGAAVDGGVVPEITSLAPPAVAETVARAVVMAHRETSGDILAFLPGEGEIRRCCELLGESLSPTAVCPLYGMLTPEQQRVAIAPSTPGKRKVVLATPIAETSLTIEGVRVVVDAGLRRRPVYDARTGLSRLETVRISDDMATQRTGRAGRVAPGVCYRLWTAATAHRMAPCRQPEILDADLSSTVLDIAAWGENAVERLPWLTMPPAARLAEARQLLTLLGALDDNGALTPYGRRLSAMPCHPRVAAMLVSARTPRQRSLAADMAALLEERDVLGRDSQTADFGQRVALFRSHRSRWPRLQAAASQYLRLVNAPEDNSSPDTRDVGLLAASAWPERVAAAQKEGVGTFRMACGDQVTVSLDDPLVGSAWLAVIDADTKGQRCVHLASPVEVDDLAFLVRERDNIAWDNRAGRVVARHERCIGCLLIDSRPLSGDHRQQVQTVVCDAVRRLGPSLLDFNDDTAAMTQRIATVAGWHPELQLPDLSSDAVVSRVGEWLPLFAPDATTTAELKRLDLTAVMWSLLSWEQQNAVDRLAPTHLTVPTGSRIRVEYRAGAELPVLRVRLQECFGMAATPTVDEGHHPVLMELLSPGFKPVQLTQDLTSFWENTYFEVRKELRRRYPKHAWPDNPAEAQPIRGVVKRK